MDSERRGHERIILSQGQVKGTFFIVANNEKIQFSEVFDISVSGMSVRIDRRIADSNVVQVCCDFSGVDIVINSELAWQKELHDGNFRIGVQFSNENMSDNVKLFMAMKDNLVIDQ